MNTRHFVDTYMPRLLDRWLECISSFSPYGLHASPGSFSSELPWDPPVRLTAARRKYYTAVINGLRAAGFSPLGLTALPSSAAASLLVVKDKLYVVTLTLAKRKRNVVYVELRVESLIEINALVGAPITEVRFLNRSLF